MSETATLESIGRRLDGLQNNVSGLNRRMITLESNLIDRVAALEARMAGLEDRADELVDRIGALATGLNSLVLLVERIAGARAVRHLPLEGTSTEHVVRMRPEAPRQAIRREVAASILSDPLRCRFGVRCGRVRHRRGVPPAASAA